MKAVVTRVTNASVSVDGAIISKIDHGLLALIGIAQDDTPSDVAALTSKLLSLRLWPPEGGSNGNWKASVKDIGGELLCVSQFTLLATVKKGSKPDFHAAMNPTSAKAMYDDCLAQLGAAYEPSKIKDGLFGAMMQVSSTNDGPITILLDTKESKSRSSSASAIASDASGTSTPTTTKASKPPKVKGGTLFPGKREFKKNAVASTQGGDTSGSPKRAAEEVKALALEKTVEEVRTPLSPADA